MARTRRKGGVLFRIPKPPPAPLAIPVAIGPEVPMFPPAAPALGPEVPMFPPAVPMFPPAAPALGPEVPMVPPAVPMVPPAPVLATVPPATRHDLFAPPLLAARIPLLMPRAPAKFLRSGSYGCTYRPPLTCDGETTPDKNTVTKLIQPDDAREELGFAKILEPVDPTQQYFVYPSRSCKRTLKQGQPDFSETDKCRPTHGLDDAMLLIMPDGGTNLEDFDPRQKEYGATFSGVRNLLEGLQKLHEAGYVHTDIKPENLVGFVDGAVVKMRFIDFGLMRNHVDWVSDYIFEHVYPWYSFELRYLSDNYVEYDRIKYWKKYRADSLGYQPESRDPHAWIEATPGNQLKPEVIRGSRKLYESYVLDKKTVGSKILTMNDTYGLGRTLGQLYYRLMSHSPYGPDIVHTNKHRRRMILNKARTADQLYLQELTKESFDAHVKLAEFSTKWFYMCESMMHPRPADRMTLTETLKYFDDILTPAIPIYFS